MTQFSSDDFMSKTRATCVLPRPSRRDYKSLIHWFESKKPLLLAEMQWVQRKEDIVTLRTGREAAGFEEFIESTLHTIDRFLTKTCHWGIITVGFRVVRRMISEADSAADGVRNA